MFEDDNSETTTDSGIQNEEFNNRQKRLEYLLKQAEIYSHFISNSKKTKGSNVQSRVNRRRLSSTEYDEGISSDSSNCNEMINIREVFKTTPNYLKGTLWDFQIIGVNWLISIYERGISGILADEMGLGKTMQIIALIGYLKYVKKKSGKTLILVPKAVLVNWQNEFKKWCPTINVILLFGLKDERRNIVKDIVTGKWDVCITNYELFSNQKAIFYKFTYQLLIVDEGHRLKNIKSVLLRQLKKVKSSIRILVTGTPLQNNIQELWSLLNFLLPDVFDSLDDFNSWFNVEKCINNSMITERLQTILRPFMLRRIKSVVLTLKPKIEIEIYVELTKLQKKIYKEILTNGNIEMCKRGNLKNIIMQLRKCVNHPYVFDGVEPGPPYIIGEHIVSNSSKMMLLDRLLIKIKKQNSKVLIFTQFVMIANILEDYFEWKNYNYCCVTGKVDCKLRQKQFDHFNSPNSDTFIFLLTTRSGGVGINLSAADVVIIYDADWNPQMDLQAMDRAHRIGQTKEVRIIKLIAKNTIDEKMHQVAAEKMKLFNLVLKHNNSEYKDFIKHGADHIIKNVDKNFTYSQVDYILKKCGF